jgi:hypothetical protein
MMQRERVTRRTLLAIRRNDSYFCKWLYGSYEAFKTVRENSVVVSA